MFAIYKKDLKSAFTGMTGWVLCAFVVFMSGLYFTALCLTGGYADYGYVLNNMTFIFIAIVPLLTMRCVEERRQKTDQLLLTSPVTICQIVWGKYLALLTVYAVPILVMCTCPLVASKYGTVSFARAYSCILAFFLVGAAALAIGLFISTLTESQIISAVLTFGSLLILYFMPSLATMLPSTAGASLIAFTMLAIVVGIIVYVMTKSVVTAAGVVSAGEIALLIIYFVNSALLESAFPNMLTALGLFSRFTNFVNGIFDVTGLVFMASTALLFVLFTCQSYEKRRWN